ncbi:MAG TPA: hypothetical protein VN549_01180 [Negativicutes bacterium]|nr:hypothetical protein [Negativicutes bacterium]
MKRLLLLAIALLLSFSMIACTNTSVGNDQKDAGAGDKTAVNDEAAVRNIVEDFGKKLQSVSLLAPQDVLEKSMKENYGEFVTQELIEKWISDPEKAPGRLTSSPWPDSIEMLAVERISDNECQVRGKIVEVANAEGSGTKTVAKRPITLDLKKTDGKWLISGAELGEYEQVASDKSNEGVIYKNTEYGFNFSLPASWKDYKVISEKWEGTGDSKESGAKLSIRHPKWTKENPRQDIPILVFTTSQWDKVQKGEFNIGAAPIGPTELGHNSRYVFALPARYNYAFPAGYEEVEEILKGNPLQAFDKTSSAGVQAYFPLSIGSTWQYLGEGNEYASFTRKVLFKEGDRTQTMEDNGGTVSANIYRITDDEIRLVYSQGEEYDKVNLLDRKDNRDSIILKAPLKKGTKWKNAEDEREIVASDASVDTPAGRFEACIKVSIKSKDSTMYEYFKAGVGMVKREFISEGLTVTSTLEKFEIVK